MNQRKAVAETYRTKLSSVDAIVQMPTAGLDDIPWVFGVECRTKQDRTRLRKYLARYGVETRDYFFPIHLQPAFVRPDLLVEPSKRTRLKVAEDLSCRSLYLPLHSNMNVDDAGFISRLIANFFQPPELQESIPNLLAGKNPLLDVMRVAEGSLPKVEIRTFDVNTGELVTTSRMKHALLVNLS